MFMYRFEFIVAHSNDEPVLFVSTNIETTKWMRDKMQREHERPLKIYVQRIERKEIA